jgi:type II secretory pathway pseudopilin PulG
MKCSSSKYRSKSKGFTLLEVMGSVVILGMVCAGVFVSIDRSIRLSAESIVKMQAFEVARENMEQLLAKKEVEAGVDYGTSEVYPWVDWTTKVETFDEPATSTKWVRGICTAEYFDTSGETQSVELECWLTGLDKGQTKQIEKEKERIKELIDAGVLDESALDVFDEGGLPESADLSNPENDGVEPSPDNGGERGNDTSSKPEGMPGSGATMEEIMAWVSEFFKNN